MLLYTSIRCIHDIRCLCYQHDKSPRRHNNNIRSSGWQKTKRSPMAELVNKPLHIIWQGGAIEKTVYGLNEWFSSCGALHDVSLIHTGMGSMDVVRPGHSGPGSFGNSPGSMCREIKKLTPPPLRRSSVRAVLRSRTPPSVGPWWEVSFIYYEY